jgi:hypothetical protein
MWFWTRLVTRKLCFELNQIVKCNSVDKKLVIVGIIHLINSLRPCSQCKPLFWSEHNIWTESFFYVLFSCRVVFEQVANRNLCFAGSKILEQYFVLLKKIVFMFVIISIDAPFVLSFCFCCLLYMWLAVIFHKIFLLVYSSLVQDDDWQTEHIMKILPM